MPAINESCIYRSMAGEPWDATITGIGPPGFVSVSLTGPFLKEPFELRAVRWSDDPADSRSGARPRRADGGTVAPGGLAATQRPESGKAAVRPPQRQERAS